MSAEEKSNEAIDLSHLGGRKIDHHVPEKLAKPIDLSHLGGRRVDQKVVPEDSKENVDQTG
jgi:hypothetical protein